MGRKLLDEDALRAEYQSALQDLESLREEAQFILKRALQRGGIRYHSIASRVKTYHSTVTKARQKRTRDPLNQFNDIVGLRVVCLFLDDIARVTELVRTCFDVVEIDNKVDAGDITSFGYMSVHIISKMKPQFAGAPYFASVGRPFEIQVRTIAMEAWATISHYLDYKSEFDIPAELKRDFHALSGTFYVADKHFQMFYSSSQASKKKMEQLAQKSVEALGEQEINADSLGAYLREKFPDRESMRGESVSDLVEQLVSAGYKNIRDVDAALVRGAAAFAEMEKRDMEAGVISSSCPLERPDSGNEEGSFHVGNRFSDVGAVRVTLNLVDPQFSKAEKTHDGDIADEEYLGHWEEDRKRYQDLIR